MRNLADQRPKKRDKKNRVFGLQLPAFGPHGFSLIEVLLVTLIITVVAALTIPNFSKTFKKFQLQHTVEGIADLMRYAQSRSVTKNTEVRLEFDEDFSRYWLSQFDGDTESYVRFGGRFGRQYTVAKTVTMTLDSLYVHFYPDASIEKLRIYACDEKKCFTISTKEQRGFVRVYDYKLDE